MKSREEMTPDELEALRKEQRERKQRSRNKQREKRAREKQIELERNNPHAIWERNRAERAEEFQACLDRAEQRAFNEQKMREAIANIEAGLAPFEQNDVTLLDLAEDVLASVETYGFADALLCPPSWLEEFQWAYEAALATKRELPYYEFGVAQTRINRDLFQGFVEAAGNYFKVTNEASATAKRIIGMMQQPMQTTEWVTLACSVCKQMPAQTAVPKSIADRYHELNVPYRCGNCRDAERKSRAQAASTILNSTLPEVIYDPHGRVRL